MPKGSDALKTHENRFKMDFALFKKNTFFNTKTT